MLAPLRLLDARPPLRRPLWRDETPDEVGARTTRPSRRRPSTCSWPGAHSRRAWTPCAGWRLLIETGYPPRFTGGPVADGGDGEGHGGLAGALLDPTARSSSRTSRCCSPRIRTGSGAMPSSTWSRAPCCSTPRCRSTRPCPCRRGAGWLATCRARRTGPPPPALPHGSRGIAAPPSSAAPTSAARLTPIRPLRRFWRRWRPGSLRRPARADAVTSLAAASRGRSPRSKPAAGSSLLSRAGHTSRVHHTLGEEAIEAALATRGWRVLRPRRCRSRQVAAFDAARVVVGEYGSAIHDAVFSRPGTTVVRLNHSTATSPGSWRCRPPPRLRRARGPPATRSASPPRGISVSASICPP